MDWFHLVELAITALVPSFLSYLIAIRDKEIKIKDIEHKYEIEIKRLESEQEALKQKHQHDLEMLTARSNATKDEVMNNAMAGAIGNIFNKLVTGEIEISKLQELSKKFPAKKQ